jgi:hypothetical protein
MPCNDGHAEQIMHRWFALLAAAPAEEMQL